MSGRRDLPPVGTEALDGRNLEADVARSTLLDIARANALFGGQAAVLYGMRQLLKDAPSEGAFTVLDVGAGMGDVTQHVVRHLNGRRLGFRPITLDHHRVAARLCHERGLAALVGDTQALPFPARSLDIVIASQLIHHFTRADAVRLLRAFDRVARWGVVIADIQSSPVAAAGLWFASFALGFHPVTRHDGVVSVQRGFTRDELARLLSEAGVSATVRSRPWWRLVATWRTVHAHS